MSAPVGFVIDASVLVAFLRPGDPFHGDADAMVKRLTLMPVTLYVPAMAFAEVAAALARGEDDTALALNGLSHLNKLRRLRTIAVDKSVGWMAAYAAASYRIRGCDAVYVALAQNLSAVLVTLDRQQRERSPRTVFAQAPADILASLPKP